MKRIIAWMPVAAVTFLFSVLITPTYRFAMSNCVFEIKPSNVGRQVDCESSISFPGRSVRISKLPRPINGHFPRGTHADGWKGRETFINEWYGKHLKAMSEPSLLKEGGPDSEVYRFLWLRTFDHPITVRIERHGSSVKLSVKEQNGMGGYEAGEVILNKMVVLDLGDWCTFMARLEHADYWNQPVEVERIGHDGAQWILEGFREGRYHAVDRWSPDDGEFRAACLYLLELAGIDTAKLGDDLY